MKKTNKANESANVVINAQIVETMPDNIGIGYAQMNKAFNEILKQTRGLNQAVKIFNGLMSTPVPVGKENRTIKEWLELTGVIIVNGKLTKKAVENAWYFKDEQEHMQLWRNVPCMTQAEDPKDRQRVYAYDDSKNTYVTVSRYQRVTIPNNGWSADVILRGLLQGAYVQKTLQKGAESAKAFEALETLFTFKKRVAKGSITNTAQKVDKNRVEF